MDMMQNFIPNSTTPFGARRMVLCRQVYFVAEELDKELKSFVLGSHGQISALSLMGC